MNPVLRKLIDRLQALMRLEDGQDLVEYAMIIALITTGATAGMKGLKKNQHYADRHVRTRLKE